MSFATLEAKVNTAVFGKLANAMATPSVGAAFPIVFDKAQGMVTDQGVITHEPSFLMQPAELLTLAVDQTLTINSVGYVVRGVVPLDEGGWQRVALARA